MLDCRPVLGWGERGRGLECPERLQTSGKRLLGRLRANTRRPKGTADIISTCVNKM